MHRLSRIRQHLDTASTMSPQKLTLYTNHRCPWAHRAHIALAELKLPFEEVIIDLNKPREPWYLEINPRGLVPSLKVDDAIITESGIVTQYLADAHAPSALLPATGTPEAALARARIAFFVDTFTTKVAGVSTALYISGPPSAELVAEKTAAITKTVTEELAPLLHDAAPFFGGSKDLTLAEVNTGGFVLRIYSLTRAGIISPVLVESLDKVEPWKKWVQAVLAKESVTAIYDEAGMVELLKKRWADQAAAAEKKA